MGEGERDRTMRLLIYSHDTFGMGNIRRMHAISRGLLEWFPQSLGPAGDRVAGYSQSSSGMPSANGLRQAPLSDANRSREYSARGTSTQVRPS
jgi:hypothetical protein